MKRLKLTRIVIKGVLRGARTGTIAKLAKEFNLEEAWSKTSYAKRFDADKKRSATTDFDRFKIMVLRKQRSFAAKTKNVLTKFHKYRQEKSRLELFASSDSRHRV